MKVWVVIVHGLFKGCYECDGGGDCDVYFVGAPSRLSACRIVIEDRVGHAMYDFAKEQHRQHAEGWPYKAVAIREWRGRKARILRDAEVEL